MIGFLGENMRRLGSMMKMSKMASMATKGETMILDAHIL